MVTQLITRWQHSLGLLMIVGLSLLLTACNPLDQKTKAGLQVITGETQASLFLDGQYLDKTPFIGKEIKPGNYTLRIQPDDTKLVSYETPVVLRKGLLTVVTWKPGNRPETSGGVIYEMEALKDRQRIELTINSVPDGAIITVNGKAKDFAPLTYTDLVAGPTEFNVSLPSYDSQQNSVNLVAGYRTLVTVKLAKSDVTVINTVPSPSPTPSATPAASIVPTASISGSRQASASAQQASGTKPITGAKVKINSTSYFQNGKEVLRVRDLASNGGQELGFAEVGSEYPYLNATENGWYAITFNNQKGWVSTQFSTLMQ